MKLIASSFLRISLAITLIVTGVAFTSCSKEDIAHRQAGITDAHQSMIERREARQEARDERFRASRESWMN